MSARPEGSVEFAVPIEATLPVDVTDALVAAREVRSRVLAAACPVEDLELRDVAISLAGSVCRDVAAALGEFDPLSEREVLLIAAARAQRLQDFLAGMAPVDPTVSCDAWLAGLIEALCVAAAERLDRMRALMADPSDLH